MLKVTNLSFGYHRPLSAPLNFELNQGELLLVSGPNGSGKSTLMKTLEGKLRPLSGTITKSFKLSSLPQHYKATLNMSLTIRELIALFEIPHNVFAALLEDIPTYLRWDELSGGMRQRVMLAMSLASGADVLILDEPANHLDQEGIQKLGELLSMLLQKKFISALIIVSHIPLLEDENFVKRVAL